MLERPRREVIPNIAITAAKIVLYAISIHLALIGWLSMPFLTYANIAFQYGAF